MLLTNQQIKLAIAIVFLISCSLVNAVTIKVDDQCTLADALHASIQDVKSGACQAGSGIDTIVLPANGHYLIPVLDKSNHDFPPMKSRVIFKVVLHN
jgi:hypothetical protein